MPKIIMLRGLPASGKSTWAKEKLKSGGDFVRVSRDDLRPMLHYKWNQKNESLTVEAEKSIVLSAIKNNKNVIIDDTNLGQSHLDMWKNIAKEHGASFDIQEFNLDYRECIMRNRDRDKYLPEQVIIEMALQYHLMEIKQPIVIVDLDGTVADLSHRLHYIQNDDPKDNDYRAFYGSVLQDKPIHDTIEMVQKFHDDGYNICFVSGRSDESRNDTKLWIQEHLRVPYIALIMRSAGDRRPDTDVKRGFYKRFFKDYEVKHVIDDRPSVIRMWREEGLDVIDVGNGVDF